MVFALVLLLPDLMRYANVSYTPLTLLASLLTRHYPYGAAPRSKKKERLPFVHSFIRSFVHAFEVVHEKTLRRRALRISNAGGV